MYVCIYIYTYIHTYTYIFEKNVSGFIFTWAAFDSIEPDSGGVEDGPESKPLLDIILPGQDCRGVCFCGVIYTTEKLDLMV